MNTCDTCKWWKDWPNTTSDADSRPCWRAEDHDLGDAFFRASYDGTIITGPKFGCVHWSASE